MRSLMKKIKITASTKVVGSQVSGEIEIEDEDFEDMSDKDIDQMVLEYLLGTEMVYLTWNVEEGD